MDASLPTTLDQLRAENQLLRAQLLSVTAHLPTALRMNEARFRAMIENGTECILLTDVTGQMLYVSPTITALLGFSEGVFMTLQPDDLCHPDDRPQFDAFIASLTAYPGATGQITTRLHHQDGTWRWMEQRGRNQTHNPAIRAIIVSFHDVTEPMATVQMLHTYQQQLRQALAVEQQLQMEAHAAQQAATAALARLDAIVASAPNGIGYFDHTLRDVLVNPALAALNGRMPAEIIGHTLTELFPEVAVWLEPLLRQVLTTGEAVRDLDLEGYLGPQNSNTHPWMLSLYPVLGPTGAIAGVGITVTDLTQHRRTEAALRASEKRLHLLAEHAHDMIFRFQLVPTITLEYISPVVEQLTGYPRQAFYDDPELSIRLVFPDNVPSSQYLFNPNPTLVQPIIMRSWHKDGTTRWCELYSWLVTDERGQPLTIEGIIRDITERRRTEAELQALAEQLQTLSRHLVGAHERERRHIARELHDEVGQVLTGLKLSLAVAAAGAPPPLAATLERVQTTMNELMGRVRSLSLDLRPALLDDLGLLPALTAYLERYTAHTGVQIVLRHEGVSNCRFPTEVETVAYRLIQEALTNVARHSGVMIATVRLLADTTRLMLRVDDTGRGFELGAALAAQTTSGLSGMYERVQLIGGILTIDSMLEGGTQIIAELPLPGAEPTPAPVAYP